LFLYFIIIVQQTNRIINSDVILRFTMAAITHIIWAFLFLFSSCLHHHAHGQLAPESVLNAPINQKAVRDFKCGKGCLPVRSYPGFNTGTCNFVGYRPGRSTCTMTCSATGMFYSRFVRELKNLKARRPGVKTAAALFYHSEEAKAW
jgi:hypothetical protein